ncbi:MAG: FAD-dependent oxidoreductase [Promethearchaeota archaeon]
MSKRKPSVLVIGGGIAGIHSALKLADLGVDVYLVEKEASLGGTAAKLGKVFPTDDCGVCVTASASQFATRTGYRRCLYRTNFTELSNLTILTLSRIQNVLKKEGVFSVRVKQDPRYVNERDCIACNLCSEICPVEVTDEYCLGLTKRKAIYLPFIQAIPYTYLVDSESCTRCNKCVEECPTNAINLDQQAREFTLVVDRIVVATGFKEIDPSHISEYGYGLYENVITQMQLASFLDPTGPTEGKIVTPKTGKAAKDVLMILCVDSRNKSNWYCSRICCTYAIKHAILLKQSGVNVTISYIDVRTMGQYEEYLEKARKEGVRFVHGRVSTVEEDPTDHRLLAQLEDVDNAKVLEIPFDLVVLTPRLAPSDGTTEIIRILGLPTEAGGFVKPLSDQFDSTRTSQKGIFVCGTAQQPKDIPESVTDAGTVAMNILHSLMKNKA